MRLLMALVGCFAALVVLPAVSYGQASAAQYGGVEREITSGTTPTPGLPPAGSEESGQGTAPETGAGGSPQPGAQAAPDEGAAAAPEAAEGTLPFTGQDLVLLLLAGLGLAGLGLALRLAARAPTA